MSRRLRSISETPSLWHEFVWPDYNRREEKCNLYNVIKACGVHIRRLSFPHHHGLLYFPQQLGRQGHLSVIDQTTLKLVERSEVAKVLQYCRNVTHLSLPALDDVGSRDDSDRQLQKAIQKLKHLKVLQIHCDSTFQPYLNLAFKAAYSLHCGM